MSRMFRKEWDKVSLIHGKEMEDNMTKRMTKAVAVSMACTMLAGSVGIFPADEARAAAGPKLRKERGRDSQRVKSGICETHLSVCLQREIEKTCV